MTTIETIKINEVEYVRKDQMCCDVQDTNGLPLVMIRSDRAGVFYGFLKSKTETTATLIKAKRVYYWSGAATLSQLSQSGTSKPNDCKIPEAISEITVTGVIEFINMTNVAFKSLESVKQWKV